MWHLTPDTLLRLSAFRVIKRALVTDQTIEPTHVAGFNQFFDDADATESRRYGVALDYRFSPAWHAGLEFSKRDLKVPAEGDGVTVIQDEQEDLYKAYLNWTIGEDYAVNMAYEYEDFDSDAFLGPNPDTRTHRVPIQASYFHPSGFFSRLGLTYVNQGVKRSRSGEIEEVDEEFTLIDLGLGYRLPQRFGALKFGVQNLFDKEFAFQGIRFRTPIAQEENPMFVPERTVFGQIILSF